MEQGPIKMGVSIHYRDPAIYGQEPSDPSLETFETTKEFVKALVVAIDARDAYVKGLAGTTFVDDTQFGSIASEVHPDELTAAIATLPDAMRAQPGLQRFLDHVATNRFTVCVDENRDRDHLGVQPFLRSTLERVDEPVLNWSNAHATTAMRELGFTKFSTSEVQDYRAADLLSACHRTGGMDAKRIAEVATYAIAVGGADALVCIS